MNANIKGYMEKLISIKNFSKSFGDNQVTKDLSFEVYKGEIFAFLGANGSGKTTTIRCLLDIYSEYKGKLLIFGKKFDLSLAPKVGYLPEERGLYLEMTVKDTLVYFAEIKGVEEQQALDSAYRYLEQVGLSDKAEAKIKSLSSGQQQKIQLGIALMHKPELLILDEPTKGLDPVNRNLLINILKKLNEEGTTIVFSTHIMEEAEKIADRVGILKDGQFKVYGKLDDIKNKYAEKAIRVRVNGNMPKNDKLYKFTKKNGGYVVTPNKDIEDQEVLKYLVENVEVDEFAAIKPSLEEIFISISHND
jgi:ABC-2 type transport system ATP-binding protein